MEVSKDGICIQANILHVKNDLLIVIYGGDKPHIGSCMLNENSLTLPNHKDDIALKTIYEILRDHTPKNICLVGGIHIDNITKTQIDTVLSLCKELAKRIVASF